MSAASLDPPRDHETRDHLLHVDGPTWPAADDPGARGAALRAFLRLCRTRLSPRECGIVSPRPRRSAGLRQEDVAQLAGVSPRWYEVFERGKSRRRFSPKFVMHVADALRLSRADRAILYRLALPEVAETVEFFSSRWTA